MSKLGRCFFALVAVVRSEVFPDVLVPVPGQPTSPEDLIGLTMQVASLTMLEDHLARLGATPTFTKHMEMFEGADAMNKVASQLHTEFGLSMSGDELSICAAEPSCLQVWTTAGVLMDKVVRITDVIGSWNMTKSGVGNVCHVNEGKDVAFCHVPSDVYKSGLSWLALGVPVDAPNQKPLPVAVRCHDMGPSNHDPPCHLLAGNEFMAARLESIDTHMQVTRGQSQGLVEATPKVVSLGWWATPVSVNVIGGGKCLDVGGGQGVNGAPVQLWECLGNTNQVWKTAFVPWTSTVSFSGTHCLDVPGANLVAGQEMWIWECQGTDSPTQLWQNDGNITLTIDDQNWCLERPSLDDGSMPTLQPCNGSPQQEWDIIRTSILV